MQILEYVNIGIAVNVAIFVATLIFSQKIKDFFSGVPSHMRAGLQAVEANLLTQVKTYETDLLGKILPAAKPTAPPPPAV